MKLRILSFFLIFSFLFSIPSLAQDDSIISETRYDALKLRNIGPAFTSGRIADIAIHPDDDNLWYVAVGSGGVWKTHNAGVTWETIFDNQPSYSIGSITIDPNNPHIIWVGTGENVGGRHVGYGDGVYKSTDGGKSWENMGLKESEHISKIVVHPENSDVIWVAAQGPLWNKGDQRGLYKSTDGGQTWTKTLGNAEWTGVTDLVLDPRNPDVMYAATWDRHRTVAAYMGGGPGSGIHKSTDGGETWTELKKGIPGSNLGKIGLAVSPQNPDYVYAAIELDRTKGGVFMSSDRGASWKKMSDAVSGGTGPHYYQELYASPHAFGRLYLMNVRTLVSDDHGDNFRSMDEDKKHSDNHALAFRDDDPDYLLMGSDGGIYESFDLGKTWRFINNMPITQFYKLSVDDAEPFYNVYGGTQDNGSMGGPSRTDNDDGIRNANWEKTLFADGHDSATEPGNPNIVYAETQQGGLFRIDRITGDQVSIQPQAREGEDFERFNWDAPIEVSYHKPTRLYFASQRVWRSENRGDSWTPISGDLTRDQERIELSIMGKQQSWDNPWDVNAMSNYNTITSLGESPLDENLIYAGTDDGLIQVTEDGGENWKRIEAGSIDGVPSTAFVNDIFADLHDPNTVYVALDNHKYGDFKPYLAKSTNRGDSWELISDDLPDRHLVWRMVQDHENPNLLFAATEFGIFFTVDGGEEWMELEGGAPTISFRDIVIQRDHNDLVAASFGRSFFVLDDYTPLREISEETLNKDAHLFQTRDAFWYTENSVVSSEGHQMYKAENPPFGAVFTYYLKDGFQSKEAERKKSERELDEDEDVPFPGWDELDAEMREQGPTVFLTIKDEDGNVINRVNAPTTKGLHRVNWELNYSSKNVVPLEQQRGGGGFFNFGGGFMVTPGTYTATLSVLEKGVVTELDGPVTFDVVPLHEPAIEGVPYEERMAFQETVIGFQQDLTQTGNLLDKQLAKVKALQTALSRADGEDPDLVTRLNDARLQLLEIKEQMEGSEAKNEIGERNPPTPSDRMFTGFFALRGTYGPTPLHRQTVQDGISELNALKQDINRFANTVIPPLERAVENAGAPPIENN